MIDSIEFRRVMGHFASGVTVVTTVTGNGEPCGLTASAVCSVSVNPVLLLVCVDRAADTHGCIVAAGKFAVNVLGSEGGESLSRRFATYEVEDKFRGVAFREELTGAPVLEASLAWLACRVSEAFEAGDHTIFLGEVVAGDAREGTPLVYYRGGYGRFTP
ncbi:MAG TPA: flavin reductase family protein [Longimicrobiaceae bacterium]|nr:flavin reductase family protein [Longimicrobiaceae bacterium]